MGTKYYFSGKDNTCYGTSNSIIASTTRCLNGNNNVLVGGVLNKIDDGERNVINGGLNNRLINGTKVLF